MAKKKTSKKKAPKKAAAKKRSQAERRRLIGKEAPESPGKSSPAKSALSKRQRAAMLRAQAARLEADALEAEAEADGDEPEPESEPESGGTELTVYGEDDDEAGLQVMNEPEGGLTLGNFAESVLPGLASLGKLGNMNVTDRTPDDAEGGPGFDFQRPAGKIRNVRLDGKGRVKEMDFEPEEWPPRGEKF